MSFLFETLLEEFGKREIARVPIPNYISDNLKPGYGQRPYQLEAFQRFILCYSEDFAGKPSQPFHLLYNMATGSGKTLVMAGLMLHLYEKGYRNFLFFVNSNNIINKTRDNFLNPLASKYLFSDKIVMDGKEVYVKETDTFESADNDNINIKFTTIQQLHIDLNHTKENSVTYEDFQDKKIVLIADEAHHLNSATKKNGMLFGSWEGTVLEILHQNQNNILLEFTATLDYESKEITTKYQDKVIFKYDLSQFRVDKYSKEINLIRSQYDQKGRIMQALILNLYRQELAIAHNINLKPVILFKAKKTIKESEQNKVDFHEQINELSASLIDQMRETAEVSIVKKAFVFFDAKNISSAEIAKRIKSNFKFENCISANSDDEAEKNQLLLNTLEDENNPIRAIFAVQKLNEGWDVLNLFDIVRLYEGQNTGGTNKTIGSTTLSEAQLIGRGARYFPFILEKGQDKFKRKYDDDLGNDLKILEELYYHTKEESRYISELRKALEAQGSLEQNSEDLIVKKLTLKDEFKASEFYQNGKVYVNKKEELSYKNIKPIADLTVAKKDLEYVLTSGFGKMTGAFFSMEQQYEAEEQIAKTFSLTGIENHIIKYAIAQNPFFYFNNLVKYYPNVDSISNFITNDEYLGGLKITFKGTRQRIQEITNNDYLLALGKLLQAIEIDIKSNLTQYKGSIYVKEYIHNVFRDKEIKVNKNEERAFGQEAFIIDKPWYAYNANYGTSEEKGFVEMFARRFESLDQQFENIYVIRNEREVKIFDKIGRAFEPDFLLFCKQRGKEELTYQVFIEPKGAHLLGPDNSWKENYLREMALEREVVGINTDKYVITGVPFYRKDLENEFGDSLQAVLEFTT